ncbi:MAG: FG-GAP repeat protein [Alphaproteobacteria bacterium]|nr:FG-GAP repeat protein [Alphaproteobacteria bacterium]MCB9795987.1 FG-GAP repeat protein [Alphaproteobacteria bacterium]
MLVLALLACSSTERPPLQAEAKDLLGLDAPDLALTTLLASERDARVEGLGDVNGDGYDDLMVRVSANGLEDRQLYFHGGPGGLSETPDASITIGDMDGAVWPLGDINGDGYGDIAIENSSYDGADNGTRNLGRVLLLLGSASGISLDSLQEMSPPDPGSNMYFGGDMAVGCDFDADGRVDLAIVAREPSGIWGTGGIHVYLGDGSAFPETPVALLERESADDELHVFRTAICAGDIDGDGYDDLVAGAPTAEYDMQWSDTIYEGNDSGAHGVFYGGPDGLSMARFDDVWPRTPGDHGDHLAALGDLDGDGYDDVAIADSAYHTQAAPDQGRLYIYHGSASGLEASPRQTLVPEDPHEDDNYGAQLYAAGDLDGDGHPDLMLRAPVSPDRSSNLRYGVRVLRGDGAGVDDAAPLDILAGDLGMSGAVYMKTEPVGDLDGDGVQDIAVITRPPDLSYEVRVWLSCEDADGDGFCGASDCDDADGAVFPGAPEVCGDGVYNDCEDMGGQPFADEDGDGLDAEAEAAAGTDPCDPDSDGDGLADGEDPEPLVPEAEDSDPQDSDPQDSDPQDSDPEDSDPQNDGGGDKVCGVAHGDPRAGLVGLALGLLLARRRRGQGSPLR